MNRRALPAVALPLLLLSSRSEPGGAGENWPQWRGPNQDGVSSAKGVPTEWGPEQSVLWKTDLPAWSGATPILWGERIFVMSPSMVDPEEARRVEEERRQGEQERGRGRGRGRGGADRSPGGDALLLLCISTADGSLLWEREVDSGNRLYRKGNDASPSPVTDGEFVFALTGNGVLGAFDMQGEPVWKRSLQDEYGAFGHNWGYACSPLLYDGKVIVEVLHGSHTDGPSYVAAFAAKTGKPVWKVDRPTDARQESPDAYTTPLLVRHAGQTQIVVSGGDYVTGHDPETGKELWRVAGLNPNAARNYRIVASPLAAGGIVYAPTRVRPLTAIELGEDGRPDDESIAWQWDERGGPDVPTPACDGTYFYMVDDSGMATCLDAKTGKAVWGPERTVSGTVSSSPVLADGKVYFTNEEGVTVVLAAGKEFRQIAANELDGSYTLSSPVPADGRLYVRTEEFLYCIGK